VTVNCARLGYVHCGDEAGLLERLDALLELGRDSLEIKRRVVQQLMDEGLFPYTARYLGTLRNHFSTLGVNGLNEMIRNFTAGAEDIATPWGRDFALRVLDHVRARIVAFQAETGHMYNLEATPAEGATYRFAKEDKKRFADILQAGTAQQPYYTNSSQLPVRPTPTTPSRPLAHPGSAAAQIYRRHRPAPLYGIAADLDRGVPQAGAAGPRGVPDALHHHHADLLDLPYPRLSRGRA